MDSLYLGSDSIWGKKGTMKAKKLERLTRDPEEKRNDGTLSQ